MTVQATSAVRKSGPLSAPTNPVLLTPKETARRLQVSLSWLAKRRMSGDGPLFIKVGRAVRYSDLAIQEWIKEREKRSTSEQ